MPPALCSAELEFRLRCCCSLRQANSIESLDIELQGVLKLPSFPLTSAHLPKSVPARDLSEAQLVGLSFPELESGF